MDLPFSLVHDFTGVQKNFEAIQDQVPYSGKGAPTFIPPNKQVVYYWRTDTPSTVNQRLYVYTGSAWVGIL